MADRTRSGALAVMGVALAAMALWSPRATDAAWDGTQAVRLGDRVEAEFRSAPFMETHRYPFYALEGSVLSAKLAVDRDTPGLVPELTLLDKDGQAIGFGGAQSGSRVKNYVFAASGAYAFRVQAQAGTGVYVLTTRVKAPAKVAGATTTGSFAFDGAANTLASILVKPSKGSAATPGISALTYQGGSVDLGASKGATRIARLPLPLDATYNLAIDPGTPGESVDVKIRLVRPRARSWNPGFIDDAEGLASQNRAKWLESPHADRTAMAFNDWNDANPPVVPATCAKCHTSTGYRDFLGDDGSPAGVVNAPVPVGEVVDCDACHNDKAAALTSVTFPSGLVATNLGKEARCMVCHQGRESTVSVEAKVTAARTDNPALDDDTVSSKISFTNIHYFAAGASLYGREAAGAYLYAEPGGDASDLYLTTLPQRKAYDRKFTHVARYDTCIECHDPHTQQVRVSDCAACHVDAQGNPVSSYADLREIRMAGTINDFDGDGNAAEGIAQEIEGLEATLYAAIQSYASNVVGKPIHYDGHAYPYFFEAGTSSRYSSWTARLLRAAYNYQYAQKDPGDFAHNGKFIVQFLYDSIADLNDKLSTLAVPAPVPNFENLRRNDNGHFDSAAEAYRHWDEDTDHLVDPSCARCHSEEGFEFVVKYAIEQTIPANLTSGLSCESCHVQGTNFAPRAHNPNANGKPELVYVKSVAFPYPSTATSSQIAAVTIANAAQGSADQDNSFICMTCHRGRESKLTLDAADPTGATTAFNLSFKNVHYLAAGATLYGSKAAVMYQYAGKTYAQRWDHDQAYNRPYPAPAWERARCEFCHLPDGSHAFEPELNDTCTYCHVNDASIDDLTPAFRAQDDLDTDPTTRPKAELAVFQARLITALQAYCATAADSGVSGASYVAYGDGYPYFVKDTNKNGVADPDERTGAKFDTKAFRASFNYNFSVKDPGAWAHNPKYVFQVLYDTIQDLGGDLTGLKRPQ